MPKTPEELEKMFSDLSERQSKAEKDFELQLKSANQNAKEYKELAEKNAEELRKFQVEAEKRDKEHKANLAKSRETEISEFVESNVKAGRIIPALKEKVVAFMKSLTSDGEVLSFEEKDGSKRTHTQISLFKEIISKLKTIVPVASEYTRHDVTSVETPDVETGETKSEHFMEVIHNGSKKQLPVQDFDLAEKAEQYIVDQRKQGREVGYEAALLAVSPRKRSLASK